MIDSSCMAIALPRPSVHGNAVRWTHRVPRSLCMLNNAAVVTEDGAQVKDTSYSLREIDGFQ